MNYHEVEKPSGPPPPPADMAPPHRHRWQAVGIVGAATIDPVLDSLRGAPQAVAQSCECGKVRAVMLRLADAEEGDHGAV